LVIKIRSLRGIIGNSKMMQKSDNKNILNIYIDTPTTNPR
jgi:hypothetical protein